MDKVKTVSISGLSFTLEEEAHRILGSYLDVLSKHYCTNPNGDEIMEGIENRIAELFIEKAGKGSIISFQCTREVIDVIGKPEEIFNETGEERKKTDKPVRKRLYRDVSSSVFAGVCSGLAAYFNTDVVWFRLPFLVLSVAGLFLSDFIDFGPMLMPLVYCILWIGVPCARTARQKCEMRGGSLSCEDIEKNVGNRKDRENSSQSVCRNILSVSLKIFLVFIGIMVFIIGISGIIALVCALFGLAVAGCALPEIATFFLASLSAVSPFVLTLTKILVCLAAFLPFAWMIYGGILILFRIKAPKWRPGLVIFLVWIAALVALVAIGAMFFPDLISLYNLVTD